MKVKEINNLNHRFFYDYKGNRIPLELVRKHCMEWEIYSAKSETEIVIVPTKEMAADYYTSLVNKRGKANLFSEISLMLMSGSPMEILIATLWGCASYGMTQREVIEGRYLWVVE